MQTRALCLTLCLGLLGSSCGDQGAHDPSRTPTVVGGQEVPAGFESVGYLTIGTRMPDPMTGDLTIDWAHPGPRAFCSASLVQRGDRQFVFTAAHCLDFVTQMRGDGMIVVGIGFGEPGPLADPAPSPAAGEESPAAGEGEEGFGEEALPPPAPRYDIHELGDIHLHPRYYWNGANKGYNDIAIAIPVNPIHPGGRWQRPQGRLRDPPRWQIEPCRARPGGALDHPGSARPSWLAGGAGGQALRWGRVVST